MKVQPGRIVPLGYGKYFRSDRIVGLEPIEEDRGPRRRTFVFVEGRAEPLVGSRSEAAILRDMTDSAQGTPRAEQQRQLLRDVLDTIDGLDPVLRRIIRDQSGWNLDRLEEQIREVLAGQTD
jgi:hypothetical protein